MKHSFRQKFVRNPNAVFRNSNHKNITKGIKRKEKAENPDLDLVDVTPSTVVNLLMAPPTAAVAQ
jgi:hypothetical protein